MDPPTDRVEGDDEKRRRLEAAWDTGDFCFLIFLFIWNFTNWSLWFFNNNLDCAFEADYDWLKPLREKFGLKSGLVDRDGKPVDK